MTRTDLSVLLKFCQALSSLSQAEFCLEWTTWNKEIGNFGVPTSLGRHTTYQFKFLHASSIGDSFARDLETLPITEARRH